jgi:hypothetical protein
MSKLTFHAPLAPSACISCCCANPIGPCGSSVPASARVTVVPLRILSRRTSLVSSILITPISRPAVSRLRAPFTRIQPYSPIASRTSLRLARSIAIHGACGGIFVLCIQVAIAPRCTWSRIGIVCRIRIPAAHACGRRRGDTGTLVGRDNWLCASIFSQRSSIYVFFTPQDVQGYESIHSSRQYAYIWTREKGLRKVSRSWHGPNAREITHTEYLPYTQRE